jgi:hypothetical protein
VGVLLQDPDSDRLYLRFRRDWGSLLVEEDEDDLDVFRALEEDLERKAAEVGGERLFEYLQSTSSATLQITDGEPVIAEDFQRAVDRFYRQHVESSVLKFRTHLPRYSLQVAAGPFLENREVGEIDWVETPEDLRVDKDMFVAQIAGRSMEPLIPDGSLCVFRRGVHRYTVKRYRSPKVQEAQSQAMSGPCEHRLESLNPDYPSWDLDPKEEKYRILAEFVGVLD